MEKSAIKIQSSGGLTEGFKHLDVNIERKWVVSIIVKLINFFTFYFNFFFFLDDAFGYQNFGNKTD